MEDNNQGTISIKKDALWKYFTFILLAFLVIGGIIWILPNNSGPTGNVVKGGNLPAPTVNVEVTEEDNFIKGDVNSKVIVVEFSDFQCPFCKRAYDDAVSQMKSAYSDEEVAIDYKQLPLVSIHPNAQKAAEASECAADQGKFVEMHDMLFESGVDGGVAAFKAYAQQLGLNTGQFNSCLDSGEKADKIRQDTAAAQAAGGSGTPYFVIIGEDGKGTPVSGAQPFTVFRQIIDSKL